MLLTFTLLVFFGAILVIFSDEFIKTSKKIFEYKLAAILIPLAIGSWLVWAFEDWFLWVIYYYIDCFNAVVDFLIRILPAHRGASSEAVIVILTLVSVLPVFILDLIVRRKTYIPWKYPYLTSTIIWLISAMGWLLINTTTHFQVAT